jgi:hypothetical protein
MTAHHCLIAWQDAIIFVQDSVNFSLMAQLFKSPPFQVLINFLEKNLMKILSQLSHLLRPTRRYQVTVRPSFAILTLC